MYLVEKREGINMNKLVYDVIGVILVTSACVCMCVANAKILGRDFESTNIWRSYWPGLCCNGKISIREWEQKKEEKGERKKGSQRVREGLRESDEREGREKG